MNQWQAKVIFIDHLEIKVRHCKFDLETVSGSSSLRRIEDQESGVPEPGALKPGAIDPHLLEIHHQLSDLMAELHDCFVVCARIPNLSLASGTELQRQQR